MLDILIGWTLSALALLFVAWVVPGISFAGFMSAFWAALVMGIVNISIRPVLLLLTLPINLLTLGFLTFIINALLFWLVAKLVPGFTVANFSAAFLGALLLSIISLFIHRAEL